MFTSLIVYIVFVVTTFAFLWSRRRFYLLSWKISGPTGYPFLGSGLGFLNQNRILNTMKSFRENHGKVFFGWLGLTPVVVVSDPVAAEKLLSSNSFANKAFIYNGVKEAVGDGLFSSSNPKWNHHRKLLNPSFSHKILTSFFPIFNREVKVLLNALEEKVGTGEFNMHHILQKCTLDIACQTTMGKVMNFQSGKNVDILESFDRIIKMTTDRIFVPWYVSNFTYQFCSVKKVFEETRTTIKKFVFNLIEKAENRSEIFQNEKIPQHDSNNNPYDDSDDVLRLSKKKNIFLEQALKLRETNDFSTEDVLSESTTIVMAAYETTANVVYTTLMCLAMFPEYQTQAYEEIITIFPDKDIEVTYEDTQNLVYLEMVINEAMRILAPVPLVARSCSQDFDLGKGVIIPKGTQVAVDIFHMQRDEQFWGPKAKTFYPDHFLKDNFKRMHPYSFMPFTKGVRNCIGWRYGMLSLKVFLTQLLRKYHFTTSFKFEDLICIEDIVLKFEVTPNLEVHRRES